MRACSADVRSPYLQVVMCQDHDELRRANRCGYRAVHLTKSFLFAISLFLISRLLFKIDSSSAFKNTAEVSDATLLNLFLTDHDASPFFPTMGRSLLSLTFQTNPRSCERQIPISSESIATRASGGIQAVGVWIKRFEIRQSTLARTSRGANLIQSCR